MIDPELDRMYKEYALAVTSIYPDEKSKRAFEITKNVETSISEILDEFRRDEEEDLLDWDACIETPPLPRCSGSVKMRFRYVGRSKPIFNREK